MQARNRCFDCVFSVTTFFQKISSYYLLLIYSNVLSEISHNARLSHFQEKKAQSSLCQCTAPHEFSLLALNEREKIGKFGICRILKQRRHQCTDSPDLSLLASMRKNLENWYLRILKQRRLSRVFANAHTRLCFRCWHQ